LFPNFRQKILSVHIRLHTIFIWWIDSKKYPVQVLLHASEVKREDNNCTGRKNSSFLLHVGRTSAVKCVINAFLGSIDTCLYICTDIYICMYICIYIYIYVFMYIYICIYAYIHIDTQIFIYEYAYIYVCSCLYTCIYIYTHIHIHTCLHIYTYTYKYGYMYIYIC